MFDQAIGRILVTRVAGNICTPAIMASLEYAAAVLVLGHEGCGAVQASIAAMSVPAQISTLYAPLHPAVERARLDLVPAFKANARIQTNLVSTASPVLAGPISQGRLKVVAGYYNLGDGTVALLS